MADIHDGERGIGAGTVADQVERGTANRGTDERGTLDTLIILPPPLTLTVIDEGIVDEAFRRGASVDDALGVLIMRAARPFVFRPTLTAVMNPRRLALGDRTLLDTRDLAEIQVRAVADEVLKLRPLVEERLAAYVDLAKKEFAALRSRVVKARFAPRRDPPNEDPYLTAEDKYVAMRAVYYRAGWKCAKRDIFDQIVETTFFSNPVTGGTHPKLHDLLAAVEEDVRNRRGAAGQFDTVSSSVDGFYPRVIAGTRDISNHGCGLAIDIDPILNPQLKSRRTLKAFELATKASIARALYPANSVDEVHQRYARLQAISNSLRDWLDEWLPKWDQLQDDLAKARADPKGKRKVGSLEKELWANPNLAALQDLIKEHTGPTVRMWRLTGILTIPEAVIEAFVRIGRPNARWGGEYGGFKDIMHLELLLGPTPVKGFDDLVRGGLPRQPSCAPYQRERAF